MRKKIKSDFKPKKEKMRLFGVGELSTSAGPTVQLTSNREASVEGCLGVIDYYDNLVKLRIPNGAVVFSGVALHIVSLTDISAEIKGEITSVEFLVRDRK